MLGKWRDFYWDMEFNNVVPFWQKNSPDPEYGGFLTWVNRDGSLISGDKSVWFQGRGAWIFSHLYNTVKQDPQWLAIADSGIDFMEKHCFDKDGRMFFIVTRDGKPLRKRRYMFSETFAVVAMAENALAHKDERKLKRAMEIFDAVVRRYYTPDETTPPKGVGDTRPLKGHAMPMILLVTARILRNAASNFAGYEEFCAKAGTMITGFATEVVRDFYRPEFKCLIENVTPDGKFVDEPVGRIVNPGHAIETSWFLMDEAKETGNEELKKNALAILEGSLAIGWDKEYGGMMSFVDCKGYPVEPLEHDMKMWWPHNETLIATLTAFLVTNDNKWFDWHKKAFDYTMSHFPDKEFGEWYGYLHRDGTPSTQIKGSMWKGPFHITRCLIKCATVIDEIMKEAK